MCKHTHMLVASMSLPILISNILQLLTGLTLILVSKGRSEDNPLVLSEQKSLDSTNKEYYHCLCILHSPGDCLWSSDWAREELG